MKKKRTIDIHLEIEEEDDIKINRNEGYSFITILWDNEIGIFKFPDGYYYELNLKGGEGWKTK